MKRIVLPMGLVFVVTAFATTVTVDPPSGVETNVATRLTGDTTLVVNPGATGGGIVQLNPANSFSGGTTLGSGTLVVKDGAGGKGYSDIGTGDLALGAATVRYAGLDGGVFDAKVTNTFVKAETKACVLDVRNDLVITSDWVQNYGTFVKTGPGTVTFRARTTSSAGRLARRQPRPWPTRRRTWSSTPTATARPRVSAAASCWPKAR